MSSVGVLDLNYILTNSFDEESFRALGVNLVNLEYTDLLNSREIKDNSELYKTHVEYIKDIGKYKDEKNKTILVSMIKLKDSPEKARTMQRNFIAKHIKSLNVDAALVGLYSGNSDVWRISFVKLDYTFDVEGLKETITPAKRYSYLIEPHLRNHTAQEQLGKLFYNDDKKPSLDEIEEVFSVQSVTDEFFKMYKEKYLDLKELLENCSSFVEEANRLNIKTEDFSEEFAKKLMGQIAFLYFLQKKGWLGVKIVPKKIDIVELRKLYKEQNEQTREIIYRVYKRQDNFMHLLNSELMKLNKEEGELLALVFKNTKYDEEWGSGTRHFIRTIYDTAERNNFNFFNEYLEPLFYNALNERRGSTEYYHLFNCKIPFLNGGLFEPIYQYKWKEITIDIPNEFFSNKEEKGLLDLFDMYNFTINEDEPLEKEVAVDPEMLGKIFENLLEIKERKSKGAFYTPREIVHYMCQESLINYLVNKTNIDEKSIELFIKYGDIIKDEDFNKERHDNYKMPKVILDNIKKIDEALATVTVADPAVGSGAFPLGMISEIVKARNVITEYMSIDMDDWGKRELMEHRSIYQLKKDTMKKSIFAVDIEPSAIDIAKLRLWLSLVVDAEVKTVNTLPNLDYNIMVGNSLIDEYEGIKLFDEELLKEKTKRKKKKVSNQIQMNFNNSEIEIGIEQESQILEEIQALQSKLFDTKVTSEKVKIKEDIENKEWELIEYKLKRENKQDELKNLEKTRHENRRPYFLWKLEFSKIFRSNDGFDIVLGNPPYIKEMDNKEVFDIVNKSSMGQKYHDGKMDYWYYFLHKAIEIKSNSGIISYITPRYWINSKGAYKLIKRISENLYFQDVVDIGNLKVFDNVVGYHMISTFKDKKTCNSNTFRYKKLQNTLNDINKDSNTENINISILNNKNIITDKFEILFEESDVKFSVFESIGKYYKISQGVVEAIDKISRKILKRYPNDNLHLGEGVFVLNKDEINKLNLGYEENCVIKKYIDGSDIKRYRISHSEEYLIYSDKNVRNKIANNKDYIRLKKHLDNYQKYITSSNKPYGIHRPRKIEFFENEKLIFKSMFKKAEIALDNQGYYVGMSCSTIISTDEKYNLKLLLGILNSNLALYWFYKNGKKRGIGVDIGVQKLREFPLCKYDKKKIDQLTYTVDEIMNVYKSSSSDNDYLENKINILVYDLYGLSKNEISKIEEFCKTI